MPFGARFDPIFDEVITPALEAAGYDVFRADSFLDQRSVMHDIVAGIESADLVVAELTEKNPNVYYELGLAHALRKPTVMIAQEIDAIPFDLKGYRVITYSRDFLEITRLGEQLQKVASEVDALRFGSPVSDYLGREPRAARRDEQPDEPVADEEPKVAEDPPGWLDAMIAVQESDERLGELLVSVGQQTNAMGDQFVARTGELEKLSAVKPPDFRAVRKVAAALGRDLEAYATTLEEVLPEFEQVSDRLITNGLVLTAAVVDDTLSAPAEGVNELSTSLTELQSSTHGAREMLDEFLPIVADLRKTSNDLRPPASRTHRELKRLSASMEQIEAFCQRGLDLLADVGGSADSAEPAHD